MRTAVYPPSRNVGDPLTNENSPFQIGLESSRFPGLYKLAVPDQQQILGPTTLEREAQEQDQGQELCTPFSRVGDALMHT